MILKNSQFNQMLQEYDNKRLRSRRMMDERRKEIYDLIPEIKEIDEQIASDSLKSARLSLTGITNASDGLLAQIKKLSSKKEGLLQMHGYPAGYLKPIYECKDCNDTGYIGNEKCHCFKQAIVALLYAQSNLKEMIKKENFSTFSFACYSDQYVDPLLKKSPLANIRRVVNEARDFINRFDTAYRNLLIYGNTGVGKTFLSNCIAKELLDREKTVVYLTAFQLFDILEKHAFSRGELQAEAESKFQYILDCDLLMIDDLGTELVNSFTNSQLYLCINERHLKQRSTVISTNLSFDQLAPTYSERIFSRLSSNYTFLKIIGEDIRLL